MSTGVAVSNNNKKACKANREGLPESGKWVCWEPRFLQDTKLRTRASADKTSTELHNLKKKHWIGESLLLRQNNAGWAGRVDTIRTAQHTKSGCPLEPPSSGWCLY
eukprot:TRINITY_DN524_c0_g3_i3.p4 TRINITY_DN524_c0_g3~~TRINITY_DN524_c0_g3_i3.p4  ORF type:complete len:106 (-),score=2.71 TRINITY_DN524_c0_g3_i3:458-775(-)